MKPVFRWVNAVCEGDGDGQYNACLVTIQLS